MKRGRCDEVCDNRGMPYALPPPSPARPDRGPAFEPGLQHASIYRFADLKDPNATAATLRELVASLTGSVLVASEGISGALAGRPEQLDAFEHAVRTDARFEGAFTDIVFKRSACTTRPFWKVRVQVKPEIVALGLDGVTGLVADRATGQHLAPDEWRALLARDDVVVLDNRNSFEYRLGHFKNAIDPSVGNFRDFPSYVKAHAEQWKEEGKRVAMYCTGGIRCEKTSAWMQQFGLDVYQLDGGILNYFLQMPDADKDWQGECFVFDNRIAIDTRLQETSTTADDVYNDSPDELWRRERAHRLDAFHPKQRAATESDEGDDGAGT
jgi:UPF0176 protein